MCTQVSLQDTGQGGAGGGQARNGGTPSPAVAPPCPRHTRWQVHRNLFSGTSWSVHWAGEFVGCWGQPPTFFCRP